MNLSSDQLQTLRHMLGIDDPYLRVPRPTRDYYCANPGDQHLHALQAAGAVRLYSTRDSYEWFTTTDAGRAAGIASHRTIRKSKGARLYVKYLEVSDCWPDLTFRQFLTDPELRDTRQDA